MQTFLDNDVRIVAGVGETKAKMLAMELDVRTVGDLINYYPYRWIDRTRFFKIAEVNEEESTDVTHIQIKARVVNKRTLGVGRTARLSVMVNDGTGEAEMVWFRNSRWMEKRMEVGREYVFFGRPSFFRGEFSMAHPELESPAKPTSALQGIYSTTERLLSTGLGSKGLNTIIRAAWDVAAETIVETLPRYIIESEKLISRREALFNIHFPKSPGMLEKARHRLKFEELLGVQLDIMSKMSLRHARANGFVMPRVGEKFNTFWGEKLPFELTGAQKRVIKEIRGDMLGGRQMNRLLQGDVGSGKTLVALAAMLLAADNGFQSCMMAPTEILARQHHASVSAMLEGVGARVEVLTGATKTHERNQILADTERGAVDILIGTHALIEERVKFENLGFVIIDEQHRFGVEQRSRLWTKNKQPPHVLVMSATPIPRTLAMTLYGDLEVSIIDELPPGRKPIKTYLKTDADRLAVQGFMKREIAKGRQIYVVYPLIKESEKMDFKDLEDGFYSLSQDFPKPGYQITAVHGKMKPEDKQAAMREFKRGDANIMVATTVIEVGVDVPNATVMVIESAERFGLSQLHQLRGRVGRGGDQAYCVLMSGNRLTKDAQKRLEAMVETCDGFMLAELDMRLRGSGDLAGTQQSGVAFDLRIADLGRDGDLIETTRELAKRILKTDPTLATPENKTLVELKQRMAPRAPKDFSNIS